LGAALNLKNLPVGQERDIFKAVQTENYSTDDLVVRIYFADGELYHRQKFGLRKIRGGTAQC
jgi:hypothetical protein